MSNTTSFKLDDILSGLLEATRHLRDGLRQANPQSIHEAAVRQVECLQWLDRNADKLDQESDQRRVKATIRHILEINQHNQKLSRNGMRSIRTSLHQMTPATGYGDDGHAQRLPIGSQVSTNA